MIDTETQKQIDELVEINKQLLAKHEEQAATITKLQDDIDDLQKAEDIADLRAENAELKKQLAAGATAPPSTATPAYTKLAKLATERAAHEGVTFEKAFTKVVAEQPGLMQQHRDEMLQPR